VKILFIRRDNIGDLVCTTPSIRAVREKFPGARIGLLVNTYNADAVAGNPDIDELFVYEKAKHAPEKSRLSVWWDNLRVLQRIRKEKPDIAIGCGSSSPRLARYTLLTGARKRIGYVPKGARKSHGYSSPVFEPDLPLHEVEKSFRLLSALDIKGVPPPLAIVPPDEEVQKVRAFLKASAITGGKPLIAFHISSRRTENRWPAERFIELARSILSRKGAGIMLLWSPGSEKNVYHPGDDEKAELIMRSVRGPVAYKTGKLRELIAALSVCDLVVCGDGGAMHIAAALGKGIVTIWGSTDPVRWRPWGVRHVLLQDESRRAEAIGVESVVQGIGGMLQDNASRGK
jgi:ADP-heptose:LPS heptosyltransferase